VQFTTTHWRPLFWPQAKPTPHALLAALANCAGLLVSALRVRRRKGHSPHDAQDLTQAFSPGCWRRTTSRRLTATRTVPHLSARGAHTLSSPTNGNKARRLKRGGDRKIISFDAASGGALPIGADRATRRGQTLRRRWVTTLFDKVLARLKTSFAIRAKESFSGLKGSLLASRMGPSYAESWHAPELDRGTAVKQAVHRMRRRYRELFREEIAQTVAGRRSG